MTNQVTQDTRYSYKADVEAAGLSLGKMDGSQWSSYQLEDGFIFADDNACPCMRWHHYHSKVDGRLLQVG